VSRVFVLVDGRNVQRSRWPNLSPEELVEAVARWAAEEGHAALVVFDGKAPEGAVGTGSESADDWIARHAAEHEVLWLVTSDRELRHRVGDRASRTTGGGGFLGLLGLR
jgi:predicted RNA-binding protein with PIN domain